MSGSGSGSDGGVKQCEGVLSETPQASVKALRAALLVAALAMVWIFVLSAMLSVRPGSRLVAENDFIFNSDTGYWIDSASWGPTGPSTVPHPLLFVTWRPLVYLGSRAVALLMPADDAVVLVARLLNSVAAGFGVGILWWAANRRGLSAGRSSAILAVYLLASSQTVVALPEHFALSQSLLSLSFVLFLSDWPYRAKAITQLLMVLVIGSITITNAIFPLMAFLAIVLRDHARNVRRGAVVLLALFVLGVAFASSSGNRNLRDRFFASARVDTVLTLRLVRSPLLAAKYAIRGLIDPIIAPTPLYGSKFGHPMLSYEGTYGDPLLRRASVFQWLSAIAWVCLLLGSTVAGLSHISSRPGTSLLMIWVAAQLLFHNVWGDEFFLYSPHWAWALIAIILMGGRWLWFPAVAFFSSIIAFGQVPTLVDISEMLAAVI